MSSGAAACSAFNAMGEGADAKWYTRAACLRLRAARDTGDVSTGGHVLNLRNNCIETSAVFTRYASVSGNIILADVEVGALCQHATMCAMHSAAISVGGLSQTWWPDTSCCRKERDKEENSLQRALLPSSKQHPKKPVFQIVHVFLRTVRELA